MSGTRRVYEIRDVGGVCGGVWVCERSRSACDEVASVWRCRGCVMCSECGDVVCVCGLWCMWSVGGQRIQLSWHFCLHHSVSSFGSPLPEENPLFLLSRVEIGKLFIKRTS